MSINNIISSSTTEKDLSEVYGYNCTLNNLYLYGDLNNKPISDYSLSLENAGSTGPMLLKEIQPREYQIRRLEAGSNISLIENSDNVNISAILSAGPTGPTGPSGLTGPTGPSGSIVFNSISASIIAPQGLDPGLGNPIPIVFNFSTGVTGPNTYIVNNGAFGLVSSTVLQINETGYYLINLIGSYVCQNPTSIIAKVSSPDNLTDYLYLIYELSAFNTIDNTLTGSTTLLLTSGTQMHITAAATAGVLLDAYCDRFKFSITKLN